MKGVDSVYKVLLVDDEPMAIEVLKYVVDWEKQGFCICGTCRNGKEGIELINKYSPDVVITDIKMPLMDGLDLIRYAHENGNDRIQFVVVSGYGEFEYAKRAMQQGVRYYLQKPIVEEEVSEVIVEIRKQLDEAKSMNEYDRIDKKAILESVINHLLQGSDEQNDFEYMKDILNEDAFSVNWGCIVIELESAIKQGLDDPLKELRQAAKEAINKAAESNSMFFVIQMSLNTFVVLVSLKRDKIEYTAEEIYKSLTSLNSIEFTIGIGENAVGINFVKQSYITALEALQHRFYRGINCVIFYNDIKKEKFNLKFNELFMSNKVLEAVEEADRNKIIKIIEETFKYFEINNIAPHIVKIFTSNVICKINNLKYEVDNNRKSMLDDKTILKLKEKERTLNKLKGFFESFCIESSEAIKRARCSCAENINISKIETYIEGNFRRNITIRELAENLYMHPAYLGQFIIQKFGIGFNEYIHELRIKEAQKLLNETDLKIHEIAQELGYCNYNSFRQQFQKFTGKKPTEFRNDIN